MESKMKGFLKEFKEFINRGSVMDMAVGVVIGGIKIDDLILTVGTAELKYGLFLQNVLDFLIVAFVIFCVIKAMNKMSEKLHPKKEETPAEPEPIPEDIQLLTEIRDLLKK